MSSYLEKIANELYKEYRLLRRRVIPYKLLEVLGPEHEFSLVDDEMKVMTLKNELDCIGCMSCSRVCPKQCHTHEALAG